MVEVVAVEVDVDVKGEAGMASGEDEEDEDEELEVEDVEELEGDLVTVGSTVEMTVEPTTPAQFENQYHGGIWEESIVNLQPTPSQALPGMQHPPPKLLGQSV